MNVPRFSKSGYILNCGSRRPLQITQEDNRLFKCVTANIGHRPQPNADSGAFRHPIECTAVIQREMNAAYTGRFAVWHARNRG